MIEPLSSVFLSAFLDVIQYMQELNGKGSKLYLMVN